MFRKFLLVLIALLCGTALGYALAPRQGGHASKTAHEVPESTAMSSATAPPAERKILYWYDPMYPGTQFDKPGKSPFMDMDLVPRYDDGDEGLGIRIDPALVQNLGLRTEKVTRGTLAFARDIPANVAFNNYQIAKVQPRAEGFVEKIHYFAVGDAVNQGAPLADITVPAWAADQSEYLLLKSQKAAPQIISGVREKMRLTGMPEEMLNAVDKTGKVQTRMTLKAPVSGVLTELNVYPGMNVSKDMVIATIQGVNPVWIMANVPESDVHLVNPRGRQRLTVSAWPGKVFQAESATLLPRADEESRTVPLRLSVKNDEGLLRPGMTASIRLRGNGEASLLIPTAALIDLGDEQRVIVRATDGSFVPRLVQVLRSSREQTAVATGVDEGEDVVVSGVFLIDSEANLRGALHKMRGNAKADAAQSGAGKAGGQGHEGK